MPPPVQLDNELLRSIIVFPSDPPAEVLTNLTALRAELIPPGTDAHILQFLGTTADKSGHVPEEALVRQHYTNLIQKGDSFGLAGIVRLDALPGVPFLRPADFRYALTRYRDRVLGDGLGELLQQATGILTTGWQPPAIRGKQPPVLQGPLDAITYVEQQLGLLTQQFHSGDIEGNFRDLQGVIRRYEQAKLRTAPVLRMGFHEIDLYHDLQPGDLVLVLGYTGQMKSTFCINTGYNMVVKQAKNVALLSLEMSVAALELMMAVIHTTHLKFQPFWRQDPVRGGYADHTITYDRVRRGELDPHEEAWLQAAIDDLKTCPDYGQFVYKEPDSAAMTVGEVRRWAEQKDRAMPLDALVVDYAALVNPSGGGNSMKESAYANIAVREWKQTAMRFQGGRGLTILSPWQSNREGFKEAEKNGGQYSLRALAWAPEAERSADLIYTVYRDKTIAQSGELLVANIKARDRQVIMTPFRLFASGSLRVVEDRDSAKAYQIPVTI